MAADVSVAGIFPGKAVLVIEAGAPRTMSIGQTVMGVKLIAVEKDAVIVEDGGRRTRIPLGGAVSTGGTGGGGKTISIAADSRGHFVTQGSINGAGVTFLVDTGASSIAMGPGTAARAGIDYRKGEPAMASTANGVVQTWRVKLDRVTIGAVTLTDVEAMVLQAEMQGVLLGMSFLNRMDMRREGSTMTLRQRF